MGLNNNRFESSKQDSLIPMTSNISEKNLLNE